MPKYIQDMLCCYGTDGEASLALSIVKNTFLSRAPLERWGGTQCQESFSLFSSGSGEFILVQAVQVRQIKKPVHLLILLLDNIALNYLFVTMEEVSLSKWRRPEACYICIHKAFLF